MASEHRKITDERGACYGRFEDQAVIVQTIKKLYGPAYARLEARTDITPRVKAAIKEGFDMIAHKLSRAMNGDIAYLDNLDDIAGYAYITARAIREQDDAKGDATGLHEDRIDTARAV